jgi:hypothetical protein
MFSPEDYTIISYWFPRLLGIIYLIAFWPFLFQIKGLLGTNGILPVGNFLAWVKRAWPSSYYYICPSLFWFRSDNKALLGLVWAGVLASLLLIFGVYPSLMLLIVYLLYLSIISVGQDFLSFGWEVFLQEVALNTLLLSLTTTPNLMVWLSMNFLLFRFHIQSGAVKLQSRDKAWRDLSAVGEHYQSQPIPNTTAWYVHKLPKWIHKTSCAIMFFIELALPFLLFTTEDIRLIVCGFFVALQLFIYVTGNFSYLNHLTAVFSLILLNNSFLEKMGFSAPVDVPTPLFLEYALTVAGTALLVLQVMRFWDHFSPHPLFYKILRDISPLHIANRYGIFAIMTTTRYEVVVEGSDNGIIWQEYDFKHKPTDIMRRPKRISPYQPRLDWQAWFLPFRHFSQEGWFQNFLFHLLKDTPEVVALIRHNPFPEKPPKFIRAVMYVYTFTTFEEKKATGAWWKRHTVRAYSPILSLK